VKTSKIRLALICLGILILAAVVTAVIMRDEIGDLILRGGDTVLTDEAARNSPQAKLAMDFLGALRARDKDAIARLATAEQIARIQHESEKTSADFQDMLNDLPADPAALRGRIKSVQMHGNRAAVVFETKASSWFVMLALADGSWKVSGF